MRRQFGAQQYHVLQLRGCRGPTRQINAANRLLFEVRSDCERYEKQRHVRRLRPWIRQLHRRSPPLRCRRHHFFHSCLRPWLLCQLKRHIFLPVIRGPVRSELPPSRSSVPCQCSPTVLLSGVLAAGLQGKPGDHCCRSQRPGAAESGRRRERCRRWRNCSRQQRQGTVMHRDRFRCCGQFHRRFHLCLWE